MSGKETSESQNIFSFGGQEHQVAGILHPFILNPFAPWDFAKKTRFEVSRVVFWSLSCCKELKLTRKLFVGCTHHGILIQMQNINLQSSGIGRKQNFKIVFGFKSDTAILSFTFRFLSSPLVSLFLPHVFSFAGHLVGFILVGKALRKAFRILGLGERKDRWVVEQDFHGNFRVKITWFLMPFLQCPWLNCAYSGMVLKFSSLCTH